MRACLSLSLLAELAGEVGCERELSDRATRLMQELRSPDNKAVRPGALDYSPCNDASLIPPNTADGLFWTIVGPQPRQHPQQPLQRHNQVNVLYPRHSLPRQRQRLLHLSLHLNWRDRPTTTCWAYGAPRICH